MGILSALGSALAACALLVGAPVARVHSASTAMEYDIKAAFLFNFGQFVDWPAHAFADPASPLVICVLGDDPFGRTLDDIVRGESIEGHALQVRRARDASQLDVCHILFIDRSMRASLREILSTRTNRATLTVGDFEGFAREGGMIRFVMVGQKMRLHINLDAAKAAQLSISSKLLRPATILQNGED